MEKPTDEEFQKSAEELREDRADLAKKAAADRALQITSDAFLDHVGDVLEKLGHGALVVGEKSLEIGLPLLEKAAIAAIQGAIERRK